MRTIGIGLTAALLTAAVGAPAVATKPSDGSHKVVVCHATSSDTKPYVRIVVDSRAPGIAG